jgi:hypothetical protein
MGPPFFFVFFVFITGGGGGGGAGRGEKEKDRCDFAFRSLTIKNVQLTSFQALKTRDLLLFASGTSVEAQ